ncbi:MAG: hypothetical protein R3E11_12900 [Sphingobium sp.]|jgi:hypothetical protein|nr:hypothetical protein [Sphingobium sp.]MCP5399296.1 hypothetical protein [Sphingomonas sp.]
MKAHLIAAMVLCSASIASAQEMNTAPPANAEDPAMEAADPNASVPPAPIPAAAEDMVPAPPEAKANAVMVGGNMTAPPAPKDFYPICGGDIQDSCMNPGEAPKGYGKK